MCGIAGFIDRSLPGEAARNGLNGMLEVIQHRGPDGEGSYLSPAHGLAVGMRRLSIIDPEGGAQPIWNEDHTVGVIFNGEIYNHIELRKRLQANGHLFRTHCDTEILVHLYEERGSELVHALRGMFGFAIVDHRRKRLLLARDHFGQKPLYYTSEGTRFAFASELKSLLTLPWVSRDRDPDAFLDYCAWLSLPAPRTHFQNIYKLPAGCSLELQMDDSAPLQPHVERYWNLELTKPAEITQMEMAVDAVDTALRESVQLHLRADVPIGVLLSSGLDSRMIASYAQELQGERLQTFTVGFGDADGEAHGAAETAREIDSQHHVLELDAEDFRQSIERVAWHLDEPVGDPAAWALMRLCEYAKEHVKVLLSGEGSDELFGGYDARYLGMLSTLERTEKFRFLDRLLPRGRQFSSSRWERLCARSHYTRASEAVSLRMEGFPGDVRNPRGLNENQLRTLQMRAALISESVYRPQRDQISELLALDAGWQLAESLLQKADKMSMAASVELRTPFVDVEVAALASRIDSSLKLPPGGPGKLVLRHCLARRLNEPLTRPKRGFPMPLAAWFTGPLKEPVRQAVLDSGAAHRQFLDRAEIERAWQDFERGEWNDGARLFYALWLYETWSHTFPA